MKKPYFKDQAGRLYGKKFANQTVRRIPLDEEIGNNGIYKRHYEQWDIHDYKFYNPDNPRYSRK